MDGGICKALGSAKDFFSNGGLTVHLLYIMVKPVENPFPAVVFLVSIAFHFLWIYYSPIESHPLKKFLHGNHNLEVKTRAFIQEDDSAIWGVCMFISCIYSLDLYLLCSICSFLCKIQHYHDFYFLKFVIYFVYLTV